MSRRAQWRILIVLFGVWAGAALWVFLGAPEPQRAPLTYVTGKATRSEGRRAQAGTGLKVRLDLLAAARRQSEEAVLSPKNIFAPLRSEEPEVASAKRSAKAREPQPPPAPAEPAAPPPPTPEELAAKAALQDLGQFRYLGYLNRPDRQEAFLSRGNDLHIVRRGDMIGPSVLVKAVTPTGVTLEEPKSHVERTVSLAEGK